jgi:hypothetical protein
MADPAEDLEPNSGRSLDQAAAWLDRERDAAWTAKLAVLRVERIADIVHLGDCLRDHQRHIAELAVVARASGCSLDSGSLLEPSFATREPHVVGALLESDAVLAALESIEAARVARYLSRGPVATTGAPSVLDRALERHLSDAQARLQWLRRRLHTGDALHDAAAQ